MFVLSLARPVLGLYITHCSRVPPAHGNRGYEKIVLETKPLQGLHLLPIELGSDVAPLQLDPLGEDLMLGDR